MCDLFGLSCNGKDRATRSLPLFGKYANVNRHGWGIAYYENNRAIVKRKAESALKSSEFYKAIDEAKSNDIIAHIRWATAGTDGSITKCDANCHPFTVNYRNRDWVFAHNGAVSNIRPHSDSEGDTDSEQVFRTLMDYIQEYQSRGRIRGMYAALVKALQQLFTDCGTDHNLNFLMSDGSMFYAFAHHSTKPIYFLRREKEYGGAMLVSTQELNEDEDWKRIPTDRLLVINRGEIVTLSDPVV